MLKHQRKMIDELCELLGQAHIEIVNQIRTGITHETPEILTLCQEFMIRIGEAVELSMGADYSGIHAMEQYCEMVYLLSQSLEDQEQSLSYLESLSELFHSIKSNVSSIPIKKEIVFLPYNAAMWDCLESIWIAASRDPEFVVSVIPIPYYEKNNQGQVIAEKYDGEKFPPYVPIVDYHSYSLEEHQPEIAYIHNPFDRFNNVTTVHPDYYSNELKKHIQKLVYVPYFVTEDAVFVTHRELPSYYYVDHIVVQCETMIDSFAPTIKRDIFIPVGSPIADRIINLDLNKPEIPDSWKTMLPNGTDFGGKKVVMFNTSLSMLMREREKFLDKIEYVIQMFRKIEDLFMVWRPHPLIYSTLQNMGSEIRNRYISIENQFLEDRIGILDKTPDVGIAVALCDAYIGENSSSLINMFGIAGKPRFYINMQLQDEDELEEAKVTTYGSYVEGEMEYFVGDEYRYIFRRALTSGEIELLAEIPGTKWYPEIAYRDIYKKGDCLYLQPYSGQGLCIYHLKDGCFRKLYPRDSVNYSFKGMLAWENFLYLIPNRYPEIVRYDMVSEAFEYLDPNDNRLPEVITRNNISDQPQGIYYQLPYTVLRRIKVKQFQQRSIVGTVWEGETNRLSDFLYYLTEDNAYDKRMLQLSYTTRIASMDGTCGIKVHEFMKNRLE